MRNFRDQKIGEGLEAGALSVLSVGLGHRCLQLTVSLVCFRLHSGRRVLTSDSFLPWGMHVAT
jgi:hypothetical protein